MLVDRFIGEDAHVADVDGAAAEIFGQAVDLESDQAGCGVVVEEV